MKERQTLNLKREVGLEQLKKQKAVNNNSNHGIDMVLNSNIEVGHHTEEDAEEAEVNDAQKGAILKIIIRIHNAN